MKRTALLLLTGLFALPMVAGEIRIITDRTESHVSPLIAYYQKTSGDTVKVVYVGKGLLPRLQARPTEADLVITKTVDVLDAAKTRGLLRKYSSKVLDAKLKPQFKDVNGYYFIPSYRARAIYYSKDRVKPEELSTYEDLANPKWKGRIAIRPGTHNYNVSLFCQMAETIGLERTKTFIKGLKANLARKPTGNDRAQVQAIYEKKADISIGNSYYMGIMLARDDQRAWAQSASIFFPNQKGNGTYVLSSGAGLTKANRNPAGATKFLEFLVGDFAQYYMSNALYVYPCNTDLPLPAVNTTLGAGQPEVKAGVFKAQFVQISKSSKHREDIINFLNEINFDAK